MWAGWTWDCLANSRHLLRREIGVLFVFSLVLLGLGWGGPHVRRGVPVSNFYTQGIFVLGCWTMDWRECVGFWCTTNNEFYGKFLFFLSFKSGFIIAFCIWEYFFSQLDVFGLWVSDSLASPLYSKDLLVWHFGAPALGSTCVNIYAKTYIHCFYLQCCLCTK